MPVYGTGYNLAVAPIFAKYGYPQVTQAAVTDQMDALITALSERCSSSRARPRRSHRVAAERPEEAQGRGQDRQQGRDRQRRRRVRHRARQRRPADLQAGRLRHRLRQVLSARHAGPVAGHEGGEGRQPGCVRRLVLSAGHVRRSPSRPRSKGLNVKAYYSAVAVAFPAFRGKFGASCGERAGRRRHSGQPGDPRLLQAPQGSDRRRCRLLGQPDVLHASCRF